MMLPDKIYDVLKWIVLIFVPALITFISGLGVLFGFDTTIIVGVIGLVATFIGSLIGVSTRAYNKEQEKKDKWEQI